MKILTKEEEEAHYNATLKGGSIGGAVGIIAGLAGVTAGSLRFPIIRHLTLPMKAFLVTSTGTFGAITAADSASRKYERSKHPEETYQDSASRAQAERKSKQSFTENAIEWGRDHRYHIVGGSWVASMGIALGLVSKSPLSTAQKLVQARVYAQGLTVAVLIATAAFEISDQRNDKGRYETVERYDPNDPSHKKLVRREVHKEQYEGEDQWKDMVRQEEQRIKAREEDIKEYEAQHPKKSHQKKHHDNDKHQDESEKNKDKSQDKKDGGKDEKKDEKKEPKKESKKSKDS